MFSPKASDSLEAMWESTGELTVHRAVLTDGSFGFVASDEKLSSKAVWPDDWMEYPVHVEEEVGVVLMDDEAPVFEFIGTLVLWSTSVSGVWEYDVITTLVASITTPELALIHSIVDEVSETPP
jgi:hypothetical protein